MKTLEEHIQRVACAGSFKRPDPVDHSRAEAHRIPRKVQTSGIVATRPVQGGAQRQLVDLGVVGQRDHNSPMHTAGVSMERSTTQLILIVPVHKHRQAAGTQALVPRPGSHKQSTPTLPQMGG